MMFSSQNDSFDDQDLNELEVRLYSQLYHYRRDDELEKSIAVQQQQEAFENQVREQSMDISIDNNMDDCIHKEYVLPSDHRNFNPRNAKSSFQYHSTDEPNVPLPRLPSTSAIDDLKKNIKKKKQARSKERRRLKRTANLRRAEMQRYESFKQNVLFEKIKYNDYVIVLSDSDGEADKITTEDSVMKTEGGKDVEDDVMIVEVPRVVITIEDDEESRDGCGVVKYKEVSDNVECMSIATDVNSVDSLNIAQMASKLTDKERRELTEMSSHKLDHSFQLSTSESNSCCSFDHPSISADFTFNTTSDCFLDAQDFVDCLSRRQTCSLSPKGNDGAHETVTKDACMESPSLNANFVIMDENPEPLTIDAAMADDGRRNITERGVEQKIGECYAEKEHDFTIPTLPKRSFCDYWTENMDEFYRKSWGHENFNLEEEKASMSDDPNMWKICNADKLQRTTRGPRCNTCKDFGHLSRQCRKQDKESTCILCGKRGHVQLNCPSQICTNCGSATYKFTECCSRCIKLRNNNVYCNTCGLTGHYESKCSDQWRRYLFTTDTNYKIVNLPPGKAKSRTDIWCPGCATQGHYEHQCPFHSRSYNRRALLRSSSLIHRFVPAYAIEGESNAATSVQEPLAPPPPLFSNGIDNSQESPRVTSRMYEIPERWVDKLKCPEGRRFLDGLEATVELVTRRYGTKMIYSYLARGRIASLVHAKKAITRFCEESSPTLQDDEIYTTPDKVLEKLAYLENEYTNWHKIAMSLSNQIKKRECKEDARSRNCKALYVMLNAILLSKTNCQGGSERHLRVLKDYAASGSGGEMKRRRLPHDVTKSYKYIFCKHFKMNVRYSRWIAKLPRLSSSASVKKIERTYKSAKVVCLKNGCGVDRLDELYRKVVQSNYDSNDSKIFYTYCYNLR